MGILDKIKSTVSTGSNETRGTAARRVGSLAMAMIVLVSMFAGGALAGSATSFTAQDYTESDASQDLTATGISLNTSESLTYEISNASGVDYSAVTASDITITGVNMTVSSVTTAADGELVFTATANEAISGLDGTLSIDSSALSVYDDGTGSASVTTESGTSVFDGFDYNAEDGFVEIGSISTWDNGSVDSIDVAIYDSSGSIVINDASVSDFANYSPQLDAGTYTYTLSASGYEDVDGTMTVSDGNTTVLSPYFSQILVDYEFTVEDGGSPLDSFDINLYDGDTIGDNESAIAMGTVTSNDSNTVKFGNLQDGANYTVEVVYTDADGNQTSYTEVVTVDNSQAVNGTVSQTVDVGEDDVGFVGGAQDGVSNLIDQLQNNPVSVLLGGLTFVGGLFVLFWVLIGLRANRPF